MIPQPASALPKPWLLAALLLLFGATLAAPASGSFDRAPRHATSSSAEAERAHRDVLRTASRAVRAVQPKGSGGGKDLLPARSVETFSDTPSMRLRRAEPLSLAGTFARAFDARAPPYLTA